MTLGGKDLFKHLGTPLKAESYHEYSNGMEVLLLDRILSKLVNTRAARSDSMELDRQHRNVEKLKRYLALANILTLLKNR